MDTSRRSPITVFTKPWKTLSLGELSETIADLGFDGVELPIRDGFQVSPGNIGSGLLEASEAFRSRGMRIYSVAGELDRETVEACGAAGVPIIRTMLKIEEGRSYRENVERFRDLCRSLGPTLAETGVQIGLQNHCDEYVSSSVGILHAIETLDSKQVSAVLDLGHTGLEGELEEIAVDIVWDRLSMVNLKNAIRVDMGVDEDGVTQWGRTWVPGKVGYSSWKKGIETLRARGYSGPICLTAEYKNSDGSACEGDEVVGPLREDLTYLRKLLGSDDS